VDFYQFLLDKEINVKFLYGISPKLFSVKCSYFIFKVLQFTLKNMIEKRNS
jgi:hypothetical protein